MEKIGLIVNNEKEEVPNILRELCGLLEARGQDYVLTEASAEVLECEVETVPYYELAREVEVIIVMGGDGTLLKVARNFAASEVAILGINLGRLGFLTDVDIEKLEAGLEQLLNDKYMIEDRMMLEGKVIREGEVVNQVRAVNDLVINKGNFSRLIKLETIVDGEYLTTYPADGLIVACPTGSTAYSLSAGGPIVSPRLDSLIITPICPHTLHSRSIVVNDDEEVTIKVEADHRNIMLTVDGQENLEIMPEDTIKVIKADLVTHLVKLDGYNFYRVLRSRLKENEF